MAGPPDSHLSWSWLTKVPLLACSPHFPAKPRPVPIDSCRTQPNPSPALPRPAAPLLLGLGGREVTAGPGHSLEPSSSWSMELHNFYGFLTPGGYSCSCSSIPSPPGSRAKESSGIGRGGSFLINKPSGKAYLGQGSGRNEISRFLVIEEVVALPIPSAQGRGPRQAESGGCRGWVCCIRNQFSSYVGMAVSSGSMRCKGQQQGETAQGQPRHPRRWGWGHGLWGRVEGCQVRLLLVSRAASRTRWEHPTDPTKMPCPSISLAWWQRASTKFGGWILCWNRTVAAEAQYPGCTEDSGGCGGHRLLPPHPSLAGETTVQGTELQMPLGLPTSKRWGRHNLVFRERRCCHTLAGCLLWHQEMGTCLMPG